MSTGPFIYTKVDKLDGKPKVSTGSCASLVQWHTKAGSTDDWREGTHVKGNGATIAKGTAVATFVAERYPGLAHGNHAALYISQDDTGIWVMDQWSNKATISKRRMAFKGQNKDGTYIDPSNNGDALSVIMHD